MILDKFDSKEGYGMACFATNSIQITVEDVEQWVEEFLPSIDDDYVVRHPEDVKVDIDDAFANQSTEPIKAIEGKDWFVGFAWCEDEQREYELIELEIDDSLSEWTDYYPNESDYLKEIM